MSALVSRPFPPTTGSPGLVQGAYGDSGNLELVVPASDQGFWVFWFNADPVEHHTGAALRCWSGGLHVPGPPVHAARITQLRAGPRYLEVLSCGGGALYRQYWTPDAGFVDAGAVATGGSVLACSAVAESDGALHAYAAHDDGSLVHLQASLAAYPHLAWTATPRDGRADRVELVELDGTLVVTTATATGLWARAVRTRAATVGIDRAGRVQVETAGRVEHPWPHLHADELAAADTTLDGGRIDVVLRAGDQLLHAHGRPQSWSEPEVMVSRIWIAS
jgi:hypothetical protein